MFFTQTSFAQPWLAAEYHRCDIESIGCAVVEGVGVPFHFDLRDATQTVQAKDAILVDTTYLTQAEQVERIVALAYAVSHRPDVT